MSKNTHNNNGVEAQLRLIPETVPTGIPATIPLYALPPDHELVSPKPTEAMVKSVKMFGVLQPIIVTATIAEPITPGEPRYRVVAGRRRIKAARVAGQVNIPATVFETGDISADAVALIENELRSANRPAEMTAIRDLIQQGASEADIGIILGLTKRELARRARFLALPPAILDAFIAGTVAVSVAESVLRLPKGQQSVLNMVCNNIGGLSGKDVYDATRAVAREAVASLDDRLFAAPELALPPAASLDEPGPIGPETVVPTLTWRETVAHHIRAAAEAVPSDVEPALLSELLELAGGILAGPPAPAPAKKRGRPRKTEAATPAASSADRDPDFCGTDGVLVDVSKEW